MPDLDVHAELGIASRLADLARPIALRHFRTPLILDAKPAVEFDPVTVADRDIETAMRALLSQERACDGVLGEEQDHTPSQSGRTWVIDPIDGTRAFVAGLPTWGVLIALYGPQGPIVSVMDQPFTGERFYGIQQDRAWWSRGSDERPLRTRSQATSLRDAIISTTDQALFSATERNAFLELANLAKIRRYSLDCYAYAALAMGGIDLVVESGLKPWDIGALIPLVTGAGGVVTNWQGEPAHMGGQVVAAATPQLHAQALEVLRPVAD